jgi:hypothetical protein
VHAIRVSFETSFDWKQRKLEPKLVLALSETKHFAIFYRKFRVFPVFVFFVFSVFFSFFQNSLFLLFRFYTKTESLDVLIEPKQTEDQPKQFDREHILLFFTENFGFFQFFRFFRFFRFFSVCFKTVCFGCFASIPKPRVSMFRLNQNKQKTHPNSLKENIFGYFS